VFLELLSSESNQYQVMPSDRFEITRICPSACRPDPAHWKKEKIAKRNAIHLSSHPRDLSPPARVPPSSRRRRVIIEARAECAGDIHDAFSAELKAVDEVQACYVPIYEADRVKTKQLIEKFGWRLHTKYPRRHGL
jgi:hypothetical protein